jgi:helicase
MVSYHYARQIEQPLRVPLFVDSGGFASLLSGSCVVTSAGLGILRVSTEEGTEVVHPRDVLELQERIADVAFSLDFPMPPGTAAVDCRHRLGLTMANAHWALTNRRRRDLPLYACVQGWDLASYRECARAYSDAGFEGVAVGGLVPRAHDMSLVLAIVETVRAEVGGLPLHVFGLGKPETLDLLFRAGVDSVDSSSYVKLAADGRLWGRMSLQIPDPSPMDRLHLALCNLATAAGRALPLSAAGMAFTTYNLATYGE